MEKKAVVSASPSKACLDDYNGKFYRRYGKRAFDLVASAVGLLLLGPILLVLALLVRLTSRGPILFRQLRLGRHGTAFKVFKFRTMYQGADRLGAAVVVPSDPRVTLIGRFLRRIKLDELPQLINVLLGDMSLVGPRPRVPDHVDLDNAEGRALLTLRPGLTSYASAYHHMEEEWCRQHGDPQEAYLGLQKQKAYLDSEYLKNVSFALDLKIIFLTFFLVFFPGKAEPRTIRFFGIEIRTYNRAGQMALETAVFAGALWLAYWLRYEGQLTEFHRWQRAAFILIIPAIRLAGNLVFGVYDMVWRYVNLVDAATVALPVSLISAILLLLRLLLPPDVSAAHVFQLPLGVITTEYLLVLSGCLGLRGLRSGLYQMNHRYQPLPTERRQRILIWGAGLSGLGIALEIGRYPHLQLVGFVDDDRAKHGYLIAGYSVLGGSDRIGELTRQHEITDLIVCGYSVGEERLKEVRDRCIYLGVKVHIIASIDQILKSGQSEVEPVARAH